MITVFNLNSFIYQFFFHALCFFFCVCVLHLNIYHQTQENHRFSPRSFSAFYFTYRYMIHFEIWYKVEVSGLLLLLLLHMDVQLVQHYFPSSTCLCGFARLSWQYLCMSTSKFYIMFHCSMSLFIYLFLCQNHCLN